MKYFKEDFYFDPVTKQIVTYTQAEKRADRIPLEAKKLNDKELIAMLTDLKRKSMLGTQSKWIQKIAPDILQYAFSQQSPSIIRKYSEGPNSQDRNMQHVRYYDPNVQEHVKRFSKILSNARRLDEEFYWVPSLKQIHAYYAYDRNTNRIPHDAQLLSNNEQFMEKIAELKKKGLYDKQEKWVKDTAIDIQKSNDHAAAYAKKLFAYSKALKAPYGSNYVKRWRDRDGDYNPKTGAYHYESINYKNFMRSMLEEDTNMFEADDDINNASAHDSVLKAATHQYIYFDRNQNKLVMSKIAPTGNVKYFTVKDLAELITNSKAAAFALNTAVRKHKDYWDEDTNMREEEDVPFDDEDEDHLEECDLGEDDMDVMDDEDEDHLEEDDDMDVMDDDEDEPISFPTESRKLRIISKKLYMEACMHQVKAQKLFKEAMKAHKIQKRLIESHNAKLARRRVPKSTRTTRRGRSLR